MYSRPLLPLIVVALICTSSSVTRISASEEGQKKVNKESSVIFEVGRYLGFRQQEDFTDESDYTFQVRENDTWIYRTVVGSKIFEGKLNMDDVEKLGGLIKLAVEVEPIDKNRPQIADAPSFKLHWTMDGNTEQRELAVNAELALQIHAWVQQVRDPDGARRIYVELQPNRGAFGDPQVIESLDELKSQVDDEKARKQIAEQVDFDKQKLLLFRWSGSGQDKLAIDLKETDKQQTATVTYKRGRTRDLRPHTYLFVLPKDAEWQLAK